MRTAPELPEIPEDLSNTDLFLEHLHFNSHLLRSTVHHFFSFFEIFACACIKMSEKEQASTLGEGSQPDIDIPEPEKSVEVKNSIEDADELVPHLHAKTFLTVFAVCLIYFAQLINVVGAGAVSPQLSNPNY